MASADVRDELDCSICLTIYTDPVTLRCGHNFCRVCIDLILNTQDQSGVYSCPECREEFPERPVLQRNITLRNVVERILSIEPHQEEITGICCTYCIHSPVPAVKSCLHCEASLCDNHLRVHSKSPEHVFCDPSTDLEKRKCSVHKELLKYYCTMEAVCICVSCSLAGEHRGHRVEMLDEASEKKKKKLRNVLQKLITKRKKTEERVRSLEESRRKAQENASGETERVTALFIDIWRRLDDLEKKILSEISRQEEQRSLSLSDVIQKLEIKKAELSMKMRHIEELCNMTDPLTVLQDPDTGDLCDPEEGGGDEDTGGHDKTHDVDVDGITGMLHAGLSDIMTYLQTISPPKPEEMRPQPPSARSLPSHTQDLPVSGTEYGGDGVIVRTGGVGGEVTAAGEGGIYGQGPADILLDVNTAANNIRISDDLKTATWREKRQNCPETAEIFQCPQVISIRRFTSGRHYWDVEIRELWVWRVGMCYPSIDRRGEQSYIGDNNKSWGLCGGQWCNKKYSVRHDNKVIQLRQQISSNRFRICLDYEAGQLSFYELCDPIRHLHTFTDTFTEPLHAVLYVFGGSIKILGRGLNEGFIILLVSFLVNPEAMASADVRDELLCSICLTIYTDPVILRCGHNFCRVCIDQVLNTQDESGVYSCPECKEEFQDRPVLLRNITLCNIVERVLSTERHQEEITGICCTYCIHSPRKCSVHKKVLEYYCTEDAAFICVSCCLIGEHNGHKMESLDEASEKKKKKLRNVLQKLMTKTEETDERVQNLEESRRKAQGKASGEAERVTALFIDIRRRLDDLEKKVLSEISRQEEQRSLSLSDVIQKLEIKKSELSMKMRHIEELCNMTDPLTVLQDPDTGDLCDPEEGGGDEDTGGHDKTHDVDVDGITGMLHAGLSDIMTYLQTISPAKPEEMRPQSPSARSLPSHTQDLPVSGTEYGGDGVIVRTGGVGGTVTAAGEGGIYGQGPADILLDVNTAGNNIQISDDLKTATWSKRGPFHSESAERFQCPQVISIRRFTSGRHYWDVEIRGTRGWMVGMCYPSIDRRGLQSDIGDNNKSWCLCGGWWCNNQYSVRHDDDEIELPQQISSNRLRICLDYEAELSFYELCDPIRHLHTFTDTFTKPLHAVFYLDGGSIKILGRGLCNHLPSWTMEESAQMAILGSRLQRMEVVTPKEEEGILELKERRGCYKDMTTFTLNEFMK
ncbi:LOW QUALITY PROTEIN: uncharacterized protein RB166_008233 [Leptodactylus fuscus]